MINFTVQNMALGTTMLGITAGILGVFGFLRQQNLLADVISHAAFPGIVGAFLVTMSKNCSALMVGGGITGLLGAVCVVVITTYSSLKKDAALGIVLSFFFGVGLVLLTHVQKLSVSKQSILTKFLFGNAATLLPEDVYFIGKIGSLISICVFLFFKEYAVTTFDPIYARTIGYSVIVWDFIFIVLQVVTIIIGLQTVGVILMSTLLIAPAAAARQWTYNMTKMIFIAAFFGAFASVSGTIITYYNARIPSGPLIVVILDCIVLVSLICAPHRGIVWRYIKRNVTV